MIIKENLIKKMKIHSNIIMNMEYLKKRILTKLKSNINTLLFKIYSKNIKILKYLNKNLINKMKEVLKR